MTGQAGLFLVQGNTIVVGRKSPNSLYDEKIASFEDDQGLYDQKDAAGFIKLQVRQEQFLLSRQCSQPCCIAWRQWSTLHNAVLHAKTLMIQCTALMYALQALRLRTLGSNRSKF